MTGLPVMDAVKRTEIGFRSSFEYAAILFDPHDADVFAVEKS